MESTGMSWRKSTYSSNGGNCLEAADSGGQVVVRDTTDRGGPVLSFGAASWVRFLRSV